MCQSLGWKSHKRLYIICLIQKSLVDSKCLESIKNAYCFRNFAGVFVATLKELVLPAIKFHKFYWNLWKLVLKKTNSLKIECWPLYTFFFCKFFKPFIKGLAYPSIHFHCSRSKDTKKIAHVVLEILLLLVNIPLLPNKLP